MKVGGATTPEVRGGRLYIPTDTLRHLHQKPSFSLTNAV